MSILLLIFPIINPNSQCVFELYSERLVCGDNLCFMNYIRVLGTNRGLASITPRGEFNPYSKYHIKAQMGPNLYILALVFEPIKSKLRYRKSREEPLFTRRLSTVWSGFQKGNPTSRLYRGAHLNSSVTLLRAVTRGEREVYRLYPCFKNCDFCVNGGIINRTRHAFLTGKF